MPDRNGFTLIEALISSLILVTGLAAVAGAFSYGIETNRHIRREITAAVRVSAKMEELKAAHELLPGKYSGDVPPGYRAAWEITSEIPRRITVIVYDRRPAGMEQELARATTLIAPDF